MEVPCVKRNAIGAANAIASSDLSMMGVHSTIPMDEVVEAMMNISMHMNEAIRETALGGLAVTPTGLRLRKTMGLPDVPEEYLMRAKGLAPAKMRTAAPKCGSCSCG